MKEIVLKSNEATEENILIIIQAIHDLEREQILEGLEISEDMVDEQIEQIIADMIEHKYLHGDCSCLVSLIQLILPKVKAAFFDSSEKRSELVNDELFGHYCIVIRPKIDGKPADLRDSFYYDINGKKTHEEMCEYLAKELKADINSIDVAGLPHCSSYNETTNKLYNLIKVEKSCELS